MIWVIVLLLIAVFPYLIFHKPPKPDPHITYDFILVLGCPALNDGSLSEAQKIRVAAAAYYAQKQYADLVIFSGSSVKNNYVEAKIMAQALAQQLPHLHVEVETKAQNTFQNLKFTKAQFGGDTILLISSPAHLRRAYFFARKYYPNAAMGCADFHDTLPSYLWEYTRMWVALYWEIRLAIAHHRKP